MNDPEVLKRRQERKEALDAAVKDMLARAPGRVPDWALERRMQMDRYCLEHSKRCIMWDDDSAGFFLVRHLGKGWPEACLLGSTAGHGRRRHPSWTA